METGEEEKKPDLQEVKEMILRHGRLLTEYKGEYTGVREMRKHVAWYTSGYPNSSKLRGRINEAQTLEELEGLIRAL